MPPSKIRRKVVTEVRAVGATIEPIVVVEGIPSEVDVGDKITPKVTVKQDVTTPIENVSVDFFVEDTLFPSILGTRQLTDVNGVAEASEPYYVGDPEESQDITFRIVIHSKKL